MTPIRRTFEAKQHPPQSAERARLNLRAETSEYYPSHRWMVRDGDTAHTFKTKAEAEK
jgi:hypothetical protein